jgi:ADP-ribose pyrophosphatase YjhB (NUDIX family)
VGAVVLAQAEGRTWALLIQRGAPPSVGLWSIPGGAVELGEGLAQACAREVAEETGLTVEVGPLVEVVERVLTDGQGRVEYHYVLMDYLCRAAFSPPRAGDDALAARWAALEELAGPERAGLTADTARVVMKAAAMAGLAQFRTPKPPFDPTD